MVCDRRPKVCYVAIAVSLSSERVHNDKHQHLQMNVYQKWDRVACSKGILQQFQRKSETYRPRFVSVDETWLHYNMSETKE